MFTCQDGEKPIDITALLKNFFQLRQTGYLIIGLEKQHREMKKLTGHEIAKSEKIFF